MYLHFILMYLLLLLVIIAFSSSFPGSIVVFIFFLLIIVRNNIVAADAFKADRQAIEDNLGIERSYYYSKCMMLFWWGIPWIWWDDWILSRIISWPTVKYPKITLTFHIFLILIFSIVYAFFLKTPFQIVIYVLFIPVFFFI